MIRKKEFISGFLIKILVLLGCWTLNSCGDSNNVFIEGEELIPIQLSVSLADNGYTSDGELIPMNTRGTDDRPYFVARILNHTLFILKEDGNDWIVMDKRSDVIQSPSNTYRLLKYEEKLSLTEAGKNFNLLPGKYRFVLYLNIIPNVKIGDVIPKNSTQSIITIFKPLTDFYFAQTNDIDIEKCDKLNQQREYRIQLELKRNSALVRFILAGDDWLDSALEPSIVCRLSGETCVGMDISGNPIVKNWDMISNQDCVTDIARSDKYLINNELLHFGTVTRSNLCLFARDDVSREILLTITSIGNSQEGYTFEGTHELPPISVLKNHITTIVIRKDPTIPNAIQTEINPNIVWNLYPPLDYIELNN